MTVYRQIVTDSKLHLMGESGQDMPIGGTEARVPSDLSSSFNLFYLFEQKKNCFSVILLSTEQFYEVGFS